MGFRFQRRIKFGKFLRFNLSKSGISTSIGVRGAHITVGNGQTRTTVGLPGSGLSWTEISKKTRIDPVAAIRAQTEVPVKVDPYVETTPASKKYTGGFLTALFWLGVGIALMWWMVGCATTPVYAPHAHLVSIDYHTALMTVCGDGTGDDFAVAKTVCGYPVPQHCDPLGSGLCCLYECTNGLEGFKP